MKLTEHHSLNGSQFITKPTFEASRHVTYLEAEGTMLHGSHHGPGEEVSGTADYTSKLSLTADKVWKPWGKNYYKPHTKKYHQHANVVEVSWEVPGYSGYWYTFQKSVIARDPDNNNIFDFYAQDYMFTDSARGGYHAG